MTASFLKLIAILSMLTDHIGAVFFPEVLWLRAVGRLAMPIFAFFIAEGCAYTRSRGKYVGRLLLFAVLSELPFDLAFSGGIDWAHQNILFTFALSAAAISLYEVLAGEPDRHGYRSPIRVTLGVLAVFASGIAAVLLRLDYTLFGVLGVFFFYVLREKKHWIRTAVGVGFLAVTRTVGIYAFTGLSFLPLVFYNGRRGRSVKWLFYAFYPGHLLILWLIARLCG